MSVSHPATIPIKIRVRRSDGQIESREVEAVPVGEYFAVHRGTGLYSSRWAITHLPTGLSLGEYFSFWRTRHEALDWARRLVSPEWKFFQPEYIPGAAVLEWNAICRFFHRTELGG